MKRIRVSCNRRIYYYACHEMIFAESAGSYTYIYLTGNRKVKHCTRLKLFSLQLDETQFFRIHHQYIINMRHLLTFDRIGFKFIKTTNGYTLPISKRRKPRFRRFYKKYDKKSMPTYETKHCYSKLIPLF